jgi:hypothetical protein
MGARIKDKGGAANHTRSERTKDNIGIILRSTIIIILSIIPYT